VLDKGPSAALPCMRSAEHGSLHWCEKLQLICHQECFFNFAFQVQLISMPLGRPVEMHEHVTASGRRDASTSLLSIPTLHDHLHGNCCHSFLLAAYIQCGA
jgi:hypothetical protein